MNKYLIILDEGCGRSGIIGTLDSIMDEKTTLKKLWFNLQFIFNNDKPAFFKYLKISEINLVSEDIELNNENGMIQIFDYEISIKNIDDYENMNNLIKNYYLI